MKKIKKYFSLLAMTFFCSLSLNLSAQDIRQDFSLFTMNLPKDLYVISDDTKESGCYTLSTKGRDLICTICFFDIDEDFELLEALEGEAKELGIDLEKNGYFGITTGTSSPLLCTSATFSDFSLIMGIYPDYNKEVGIFVCLCDTNKDISKLTTRMSSFRLK